MYVQVPGVCILLSVTTRGGQLKWYLQHVKWRANEWWNVMFTDESRFALKSDNKIWVSGEKKVHRTMLEILIEPLHFNYLGYLPTCISLLVAQNQPIKMYWLVQLKSFRLKFIPWWDCMLRHLVLFKWSGHLIYLTLIPQKIFGMSLDVLFLPMYPLQLLSKNYKFPC